MMQYVNREYSSNRDDDGMDTFRVDLWIKKIIFDGSHIQFGIARTINI